MLISRGKCVLKCCHYLNGMICVVNENDDDKDDDDDNDNDDGELRSRKIQIYTFCVQLCVKGLRMCNTMNLNALELSIMTSRSRTQSKCATAFSYNLSHTPTQTRAPTHIYYTSQANLIALLALS